MAAPASTRRQRDQDLVAAARALFDERGVQDASIDDVARAVGINRALVYRSFASKEELFFAAVASYLEDLAALGGAVAEDEDPVAWLRGLLEVYTRFCLEQPAFLDCALSLMRRPAAELREVVSDALWLRLGQRMASCLAPLSAALARGAEQGRLDVADPDFTANRIYTQVLGTMHLARIQLGVREAAPGVPGTFPLDPGAVRAACVDDALRLARIAG